MNPNTLTRFAPLTGVVAVLLTMALLVVEGQPPDADAATEEVVRFYSEHDARLVAATAIGGLGAAFLIWFGGCVFSTLRRAEGEPGWISAIAFGGFLLVAVGLAMLDGFVFAAAQTVGDVPAEVTQTMAVLAALFIVPFAVGALVALLALAVGILRHGVLPQWLGYTSVAIAVGFVAAAGFGTPVAIGTWILGTLVWVLMVSVVVFLSGGPKEQAAAM